MIEALVNSDAPSLYETEACVRSRKREFAHAVGPDENYLTSGPRFTGHGIRSTRIEIALVVGRSFYVEPMQ